MKYQIYFLALIGGLIGLITAHSDEMTLSLASPSDAPSPVIQNCNEITTDRYATRRTLDIIIRTEFCPRAINLQPPDHKVEQIFNKDTPEEVLISVNWEKRPEFKLSLDDDCIHYLRNRTLDGCNGNDPENPMNWKAGGQVEANSVLYLIQPLRRRQPPPKAPQGGCTVKHDDARYHYVKLWGGGWEGSDFGKKLQEGIQNCNPLIDTFNFAYGFGDDGGEWKATVYLAEWDANCVVEAAKKAGAQKSFGCSEN